jgi:hypothetical protein
MDDQLKRRRYVPVQEEAEYQKLLGSGYVDLGLTAKGGHHKMILASISPNEIAEAVDTTFGLESDLQKALRKNIEQLESGLKIVDGGKETIVESGRIDILAEDANGMTVVIELKAGEADRKAVGQILGYMGDLMTQGKTVRGILIAGDFPSGPIAAARAVPNLQLQKYKFQFSFEAVGSQIAQAMPAA